MVLTANLIMALLYFRGQPLAAVELGGIIWTGFGLIDQERIRFYITAQYVQDRTGSLLLTIVLMAAGYVLLYCCIGELCCVVVPLASLLYLGDRIRTGL